MENYKMPDIIKNVREVDDELIGDIYFSLFKQQIELTFFDGCTEYAVSCVNYLNELNDKIIEALCLASIRYCNTYLAYEGEPQKQFDEVKDVLKLIQPRWMWITDEHERFNSPIVSLELECDWEPEHGLEWLIYENKVLYVRPHLGADPDYDFESEHLENYAPSH